MMTAEVACTIERRLLLNYRIDPELVSASLPAGFRPQLVSGWAVGGICLIRLSRTRPSWLPGWFGFRSENAAHRFAVEWDDNGETNAGVYIPRRDTNSLVVAVAGGPVFPGVHHRARFDVTESSDEIRIALDSSDRMVRVEVEARSTDQLDSQLFETTADAMQFFKRGSVGWSPSATGALDLVRLVSDRWTARPVAVGRVISSVFDDHARFPSDRCSYDSALLMENLKATWIGRRSVSQPCNTAPPTRVAVHPAR